MTVYIISYQVSSFTRTLYIAKQDAKNAREALEMAKRQDLIPNNAKNWNVTTGIY